MRSAPRFSPYAIFSRRSTCIWQSAEELHPAFLHPPIRSSRSSRMRNLHRIRPTWECPVPRRAGSGAETAARIAADRDPGLPRNLPLRFVWGAGNAVPPWGCPDSPPRRQRGRNRRPDRRRLGSGAPAKSSTSFCVGRGECRVAAREGLSASRYPGKTAGYIRLYNLKYYILFFLNSTGFL